MRYLNTVLVNGRVRTLGRGKIDLDMWGKNIERMCSLGEVPAL